ncbi:MAG TPA: AbrB/MazE/SpoVT family DNA-binding domain-containing protein [Roseiarcus sp.]|nr:AbrB/MazE/SpoVT family DNA-binding domain-containing protein [Roseiarcus sp.]
MAKANQSATRISTKGQVILPKAIRDQRNWRPGTRLIAENTAEGVLLKAAPSIPRTKPKDVFGMLAHSGAPMTLEDMDAAITAEARRRYARY